MKITVNLDKGGYGQIYSSGPVFGFVSDKGEHCHPFYFCKDFMNDAVSAQFNNKHMGIYGFSHDPSKNPNLDLKKTRILFSNKDDSNLSLKVESIQDLLNQACKILKLPKCKVEDIGTHGQYKTVLYITGSNKWMLGGPILSLFTLLIRVGAVHTIGVDIMQTLKDVRDGKLKPYGYNDSSYLKSAWDGIEFIFKNGVLVIGDMKQNYNPNIAISIIHNTGIVGYANSIRSPKANPDFPHWGQIIQKITK